MARILEGNGLESEDIPTIRIPVVRTPAQNFKCIMQRLGPHSEDLEA